jgi:hypothetical protein
VEKRQRAGVQRVNTTEVPAFQVNDYVCVTVGKKNYAGQVRKVHVLHDFKKGKGPETMDYMCEYWLDNKSSQHAFLLKDKVTSIALTDVPLYITDRKKGK